MQQKNRVYHEELRTIGKVKSLSKITQKHFQKQPSTNDSESYRKQYSSKNYSKTKQVVYSIIDHNNCTKFTKSDSIEKCYQKQSEKEGCIRQKESKREYMKSDKRQERKKLSTNSSRESEIRSTGSRKVSKKSKSKDKHQAERIPTKKSHQIKFSQINLKPSDEYYNNLRSRHSKSKGKINQKNRPSEDQIKKEYFQSLYMHQDDGTNEGNYDCLEIENSIQGYEDQGNSPEKLDSRKGHGVSINKILRKKVKMFEGQATIDADGKYVISSSNRKSHKESRIKLYKSNQKDLSSFLDHENETKAETKKLAKNKKTTKSSKLINPHSRSGYCDQQISLIHGNSASFSMSNLMENGKMAAKAINKQKSKIDKVSHHEQQKAGMLKVKKDKNLVSARKISNTEQNLIDNTNCLPGRTNQKNKGNTTQLKLKQNIEKISTFNFTKDDAESSRNYNANKVSSSSCSTALSATIIDQNRHTDHNGLSSTCVNSSSSKSFSRHFMDSHDRKCELDGTDLHNNQQSWSQKQDYKGKNTSKQLLRGIIQDMKDERQCKVSLRISVKRQLETQPYKLKRYQNEDHLLSFSQERLKVLAFVGKVCEIMQIKRQSHNKTLFYLDWFTSIVLEELWRGNGNQITKKSLEDISFDLKKYAITALLIALKMDDGMMARKLSYELNNNMEGLLEIYKHANRIKQRGREKSRSQDCKRSQFSRSKGKSSSKSILMSERSEGKVKFTQNIRVKNSSPSKSLKEKEQLRKSKEKVNSYRSKVVVSIDYEETKHSTLHSELKVTKTNRRSSKIHESSQHRKNSTLQKGNPNKSKLPQDHPVESVYELSSICKVNQQSRKKVHQQRHEVKGEIDEQQSQNRFQKNPVSQKLYDARPLTMSAIMDCEIDFMNAFDFRLSPEKTVTYWTDCLMAFWDDFVSKKMQIGSRTTIETLYSKSEQTQDQGLMFLPERFNDSDLQESHASSNQASSGRTSSKKACGEGFSKNEIKESKSSSKRYLNISYLVQVVEKIYLKKSYEDKIAPFFGAQSNQSNSNSFQGSGSEIYHHFIVLAAVYLIIRIRLQLRRESLIQESKSNFYEHKPQKSKQESVDQICFERLLEKYSRNLTDSTNIIFFDNGIGINELFSEFLLQFNLNLSDIVDSIRFVGIYGFKSFSPDSQSIMANFSDNQTRKQITQKKFKLFEYELQGDDANREAQSLHHRVSLYQFNSKIYSN